MVERSAAYGGIRVTQAAEPVLVFAEQVGVDGTDAKAALLGIAAELAPVVDPVPRSVDRDARATPGQLVDERSVRDPFPDRARRSWPRIDVEARARVAVAPGGGLDLDA